MKLLPSTLGSNEFKYKHHTRYALYSGGMANGIASEELVIAMGKAGFLASFGSGGLTINRIEKAIIKIQSELPNGPYMFNLLHNPLTPALEIETVELYMKYGITTIEASAYLTVNWPLALFRIKGLVQGTNGIERNHHIIAKVSRIEIARQFLSPVSERILSTLLSKGLITEEEARLARQVPLAEDIVLEADSGGHTDNRPMTVLFSGIVPLRNTLVNEFKYNMPILIGLAGGIGNPISACAAFAMGADFIVTGSINQSCIEAGISDISKALLAQASVSDFVMAPAADMFEMGAKVQVLKQGTLFAIKADKLYQLYNRYQDIDSFSNEDKTWLEQKVFYDSIEATWLQTKQFFEERDPKQLEDIDTNKRKKLAFLLRTYLGLSSRWAISGEPGKEIDYQIWCGPSMGGFNEWVKGSYLEYPENRRVADINYHILIGAAGHISGIYSPSNPYVPSIPST